MVGASAKAASERPKGGNGKSARARGQNAVVAQFLEDLQPIVLAAFENDNVGSLPRPELAVRIGQIVTTETEQESLNLLERRNLVGGLITWLLHCSPKAPPKPVPAAAKPAANRDGIARGATPPPNSESECDAKAQDESAAHSKTISEAKQTIQPLVMDRLDVSAASQLPREDLSHQLRDIVMEVLDEEKLRLNSPEQTAVVELLLDDMLGLGPLEPLLADESITDILVNGPFQTYIERHGKR